jgi:FMN-dependent NADH-azoreductase
MYAVVGSYRKGGIIDSTVDEILASAKENGAEVTKIYLIDNHIEFCRNCRICTEQPGKERGKRSVSDGMTAILDELETSDAIVLASPMNFWAVTAVMKRFIERLVCYAYWPWGAKGPQIRRRDKTKRAVIVISSAAPSLMGRLMMKTVGLLKRAADLLGARTIGVLYIGLAACEEKQQIPERIKKKARKFGQKLVSN